MFCGVFSRVKQLNFSSQNLSIERNFFKGNGKETKILHLPTFPLNLEKYLPMFCSNFQVISYFYYRRASWNVVGRIKEYPKEPLPSIQFLQMDFDTCVLEQNPECRYVQDSDVEPVDCIECGGHFSQMAQFCGHDPVRSMGANCRIVES